MSSEDESKIVLRLRLRVGEDEIQLEGSRKAILEMIENDLPRIVESISKILPAKPSAQVELQPSGVEAAPTVGTSPPDVESYPSVQAKTCSDAIVGLLSTSWGRRKPRTLSEIKEALEASALHYSTKVIGFTLTRLTRRQKIRRWKSQEGFIYTVPA